MGTPEAIIWAAVIFVFGPLAFFLLILLGSALVASIGAGFVAFKAWRTERRLRKAYEETDNIL
jgi:hypothetical protein